MPDSIFIWSSPLTSKSCKASSTSPWRSFEGQTDRSDYLVYSRDADCVIECSNADCAARNPLHAAAVTDALLAVNAL
jgi:hypothetical protein